LTLSILMLAVALLAPVAVLGAERFTDVGADHVFVDDVEAIADAGVTKGCNPPENTQFCPEGVVNRGQMAAFMNRLGALDGSNPPVVDARTVQGLGLYADIVTVDVANVEDNNEECENTESLLGPDHEFGSFFTTYQLLGVPNEPDLFTFDINVTASDRDPLGNLPESGFLICFATVDGRELPDGEYTLFRIEAHEMSPVSD
jgi:hypothetical protein